MSQIIIMATIIIYLAAVVYIDVQRRTTPLMIFILVDES